MIIYCNSFFSGLACCFIYFDDLDGYFLIQTRTLPYKCRIRLFISLGLESPLDALAMVFLAFVLLRSLCLVVDFQNLMGLAFVAEYLFLMGYALS